VPKKMVGIDPVVTNQAQQGRTIAPPIRPPQVVGIATIELQVVLHIIGHARIDRAKHRMRRIVQGVVKIEEPD